MIICFLDNKKNQILSVAESLYIVIKIFEKCLQMISSIICMKYLWYFLVIKVYLAEITSSNDEYWSYSSWRVMCDIAFLCFILKCTYGWNYNWINVSWTNIFNIFMLS